MRRPRPEHAVTALSHSIYASTPDSVAKVQPELSYYAFAASLRTAFSAASPEEPMFRVSTTGLYEAYLEYVPGRRCRSCSKFFYEYGGAVRVDGITGRVTSALWNENLVPDAYARAAEVLRTMCESRPVVGVLSTCATHLCDPSFEAGLGHMHLYGPYRLLPETGLQAAFGAVSECVGRFSLATATKALGVLRRLKVERVVPMITRLTWLAAYLRRAANIRDADRRANLLWYDVASAPEELFHEGHPALLMLLRNIDDGLRARSALAELSRDLDRTPRQWP